MFILIVLHVLAAFALVGGIIGRNVVLWQAARASDVHATGALVGVSGMFERLMIIPGSFAVLAFGLLAAWARGIPLLGFIEGASTNWLLISLVLYLSLMALVPTVFIPHGKAFDASLQQALAKGEITSDLRTAFANRTVTAARTYELIAASIIIVLMVARPF
ncbi:MAG TPA: DUF2269 family protein [Ktedonobacterales bacterium]|jgi:hypothetical protein|nr:DUF2269 family protein [Ktedonobacterales bacterium]